MNFQSGSTTAIQSSDNETVPTAAVGRVRRVTKEARETSWASEQEMTALLGASVKELNVPLLPLHHEVRVPMRTQHLMKAEQFQEKCLDDGRERPAELRPAPLQQRVPQSSPQTNPGVSASASRATWTRTLQNCPAEYDRPYHRFGKGEEGEAMRWVRNVTNSPSTPPSSDAVQPLACIPEDVT